MRGRLGADQKLILWLAAVMVLLIVGVIALSPQQEAEDTSPTSTNAGALGVKAAYLTLEGLGHRVSRWTKPLDELNGTLSDAQVANTTLVLIDPVIDATQKDKLVAEVTRFLGRGGRLLTTGHGGALLLGAKTDTAEILQTLCATEPEGDSALARAGKVQITNEGGWDLEHENATGPHADAAQRCGKNAVVVGLQVQNGTVVWWSSASPMANAELKKDPALKLLLASVDGAQYSQNDAPRDVIFDEAMHAHVRDKWAATKGLPIAWVSAQAALLFVLLVLSFSRRRGPVRMPVGVPRSSPVEFAVSMGDLVREGRGFKRRDRGRTAAAGARADARRWAFAGDGEGRAGGGGEGAGVAAGCGGKGAGGGGCRASAGGAGGEPCEDLGEEYAEAGAGIERRRGAAAGGDRGGEQRV